MARIRETCHQNNEKCSSNRIVTKFLGVATCNIKLIGRVQRLPTTSNPLRRSTQVQMHKRGQCAGAASRLRMSLAVVVLDGKERRSSHLFFPRDPFIKSLSASAQFTTLQKIPQCPVPADFARAVRDLQPLIVEPALKPPLG